MRKMWDDGKFRDMIHFLHNLRSSYPIDKRYSDIEAFITRAIISAVRENLEKVRPWKMTDEGQWTWDECSKTTNRTIDKLLTEIDEMGKELKP